MSSEHDQHAWQQFPWVLHEKLVGDSVKSVSLASADLLEGSFGIRSLE